MSTLLLFVLACVPAPPPAAPSAPKAPPAAQPTIQQAMAARPLVKTHHGTCRMACRKIDDAEVTSVLNTGVLIAERTRNDGECPSHAIEGKGTDGHALRIVFAACSDETRLVTAIDLDEDWPCSCD
jgi:hypothetical protein